MPTNICALAVLAIVSLVICVASSPVLADASQGELSRLQNTGGVLATAGAGIAVAANLDDSRGDKAESWLDKLKPAQVMWWLLTAFFVIVTGVVARLFGYLVSRRAVLFMADCLFNDSAYPRLSALVALVRMRCWSSLQLYGPKLESQDLARLRVEFDIFAPLLLGQTFDGHTAEKPRDPAAEKHSYKNAFRKSIKAKESERTLVIPNCTYLVNSRDKVKQYFDALAHFDIEVPSANNSFLFKISVKEGYVAAQHLICGLLARIDMDWKFILNQYTNLVDKAKGESSLVELQLFQLNCWLLWGPSIPICGCAAWSKATVEKEPIPGQQPAPIAKLLQFGYGDESNSVYLGVTSTDTFEKCKEGISSPALKFDNLTGRLFWSRAMNICKAQSYLNDDDGAQPVLMLEKELPSPKDENSYYSSYIWVMFVLCKDDPANRNRPDKWTLLFENGKDEDNKWRNLLPFFEHSNIADASTLTCHLDTLVAKVASAASKLLEKEENKAVRLRYVCASDESFCKKGIKLRVGKEPLLRERLRESLQAIQAAGGIAKGASRIDVPDAGWYSDPLFHDFVSCNLPSLVSAYEATILMHTQDPRKAEEEARARKADIARIKKG